MGPDGWRRWVLTGGIAVTPFTVALLVNPQENGLVDQAGWVAGALGPAVAFLLFFLQNRTTRHEQAPARAANEAGHVERGTPPRVGPAALPPVETVAPAMPMQGRKAEQTALRERLLGKPGGVVIVSGAGGAGKSRLVNAVLDELRKRRRSPARPHIISYQAAPDRRLPLKALVEDMERLSGVQAIAWEHLPDGAAPPDHFRATVEALGERPLVIVVENAEHLMDTGTGEIASDELNQAFEILATTPGHRVHAVLVTRTAPKASERHVWPAMAASLEIGALPVEHFTRYLDELDKATGHDLAGLLTARYERLHGNPRHAELAHAILASPACDGRRLNAVLLDPGADGLSWALVDELADVLGLTARRVLEALDAFGTAIDAAGVCAVLKDMCPEDEVKEMLSTLVAKGVVQTTPDGQYHLPPSGADWLGRGAPDVRLSEARQSILLFDSANQLYKRRVRNPSGIEDLRVDFAGVRAHLRTGVTFFHAYKLIEYLDAKLSVWNCEFLLTEQREALRGRLDEPIWAQQNENALGHLYAAQGRFTESIEAYGNAMLRADALEDEPNRIRIEVNLAGSSWWQGDVKKALTTYDKARKDCDAIIRDDPELRPVRMGALEGMADCHRHHGRYDEALDLARQAMGEPDDPAYPHTAEGERTAGRRVDLALKLARWHSELAEDKEADGLLAIARTEIRIRQPKGGQRADLWARYYAEAAGINLLRGLFHEARAVANLAVDDALAFGDPLTLLRARTSLSYAYLLGETADVAEATRQIESAARYRRPGGPLLVPALRALVAPGADDARARFTQLLEEAGERIGRDDDDVSAWNYLGFARCGLAFSADDAIEAFRSAREKMALRPAPNRAGHLIAMIELLDRRSATPGRLQPVIHDLRTAGARPTGA